MRYRAELRLSTLRLKAVDLTAKVAIDLSLDRLFDYDVPEAMEKKLAVGQLLSVPFGRRMARGFLMALHENRQSTEIGKNIKLKPIYAIEDEVPFFSGNMIKLVNDISSYFAAPVESVLRAAVPAAVLKRGAHEKLQLYVTPVAINRESISLSARQKWLLEQIVRLEGGWLSTLCRELGTSASMLKSLKEKGLLEIKERQKRRVVTDMRHVMPVEARKLNEEQTRAVNIIATSNKPVLLKGVTGSGKTEVYLHAISNILDAGGSAIVMVPEIALTSQTVQRFASRFGNEVAVMHSALSEGERYDEWHRIRSGHARVIIGARSAVFAPVVNLKLIVVDEEHEPSYKQEDNPRYNGRDVAIMRAAIEGAKVILGSATPSLESWANFVKGKYALAEIKRRAGNGRMPSVRIVDMLENEGGPVKIYSQELLSAIGARLRRHEQVILFLNRRGYSKSVECPECGYVMECEDCATPYTYHIADDCLRCHICGVWQPCPNRCPRCGSQAIRYKGIGTQRAEIALSKIFKEARILRMDSDTTTRKNSHMDILGAFRRHEADVLLGTQMIAKGLDFPNVTLVGVLNADSSLNMPDFRAAERTFQLIAQVSGRAGRADLPGEVILQTKNAEDATILAATRGDYDAFARTELATRMEYRYPPYRHYSIVRIKSKDTLLAKAWAELVAKTLGKVNGLEVAQAIPCVQVKAEGWYRWQIAVMSDSAKLLVKSWKWLENILKIPSGVKIGVDVDAYNMI